MTRESVRLLSLAAAALAAALIVAAWRPFAFEGEFFPPPVKSVFGWLAAALTAVSAAYSLRRRLFLQWPGPLITWKLAHVVTGLLAMTAMFLHSGGGVGAGVAALMALLMAGITATGAWGAAAQGFAPGRMTRSLQDPVYKSEMQDEVNLRLASISLALKGKSPAFAKAYQRHILPAIAIDRPTEDKQKELYARYSPGSPDRNAAWRDLGGLAASEREEFFRMAETVMDIIELRRVQAYQQLMNRWLDPHILLSVLLLTVMILHVAASFYF